MSRILRIPVKKHWLWYVRNNDVVFEQAITKGMDRLLMLMDSMVRRRK